MAFYIAVIYLSTGLEAFISGDCRFFWLFHMLDFNVNIQLDVMEWINKGGLEIHDFQGYHWSRLITLTGKYSDISMDLADGTLIIVSEELKIREILTIDSDFYVYRNVRNEYLTNVLV